MTPSELVATTLKHLKPNIPIYREQQRDGQMQYPSFFVQQLATQMQTKMTDEQIRHYNFDVVFLINEHLVPNKPTPVEQLEAMNEFMSSNLDWIVDSSGKKMYRVQKLSTDYQNNDLHISFSFVARLGQSDDGDKMSSLKQNGGFVNG